MTSRNIIIIRHSFCTMVCFIGFLAKTIRKSTHTPKAIPNIFNGHFITDKLTNMNGILQYLLEHFVIYYHCDKAISILPSLVSLSHSRNSYFFYSFFVLIVAHSFDSISYKCTFNLSSLILSYYIFLFSPIVIRLVLDLGAHILQLFNSASLSNRTDQFGFYLIFS